VVSLTQTTEMSTRAMNENVPYE